MAEGGRGTVKDKKQPADRASMTVDSPDSYSSPSAVRRPPLTQLRWRCRRGMRELDVVLERYLEQRYASAPETEQRAFESLLDLPDPQLFAYLMRRETPVDSGWVDVIAKLAAFEPGCSYTPN
jgi:antitoxin CptB